MSKIGDNSNAVAKDQLKSIVGRIEKLSEEKDTIASDIRDIYAEAKSNGYSVPALREIIRRRKADKEKQAEHDAMVDLYMSSLGMLVGTPLADAAVKRDIGNIMTAG